MKLSVCMATYNGAQFVIRQLNTVIDQLNITDEIIIVDDRSTDGTVEVIKNTFGDRINVYINQENEGPIKSFEKAISLANGEIIFLCDQDDLWEENKVETVLSALINEKADLAVHDAFVVDGDLEIIHSSWNQYNGNEKKGLVGNIMKNSFTGCCMAFKRELKPLILPFPSTIEMHDQWIALVSLLEKKKICYIDKPLMKYVRHGGNVTGMKKRSITARIKGRLGTIKAVAQFKRN